MYGLSHAGDSASRDNARADAARLIQAERYDEAADILLQLHRDYPEDKRVLFDCVAVLAWAGRYQESADLSGDYLEIRPPRYSLGAAALAFRRVGKFDQAISLYMDGQKRYPGDSDFVIGHILTLADAGRHGEAQALAAKHRQDAGDSPALAEVEEYLRSRLADTQFRQHRQQVADLAGDGKYDEALEELSRLEKIWPDSPVLGYDRLTILSWAGRYREAARLAGSISLDDAPEYVRQAAAVSFRESGDAQAAETLYRQILAGDPGNPRASEGLALTLTRAKRLDEAEEFILRHDAAARSGYLRAAEDELVSLRRDAAGELAINGKYDPALAELERLNRTFPGRVGVDHDILTVLSWAGRHREALAKAAGLDLDAVPDYVRQALARSCRDTGDFVKAESLYRGLLEKHRNNPDLIEGLCLTLIGLKRLDEVERLLDRHQAAGMENLKSVEANVVAGRRDEAAILARSGQYDEALAKLDALRQWRPGYPEIDYDRLLILSWNARHREAAALADRMRLDDAPDFVRQAAAATYRETGNTARSEELYRVLVAADPANADLAEGLALTLIRAGRIQEAQALIDTFRTASAPNALPAAENALIAALRDDAAKKGRLERYDEAIAGLDALHRRHPEHPGVLHDYIAILSWAGRSADAVKLGKNLDPSAMPEYAAEAVASSLRREGMHQEALDYFRRAVERYPDNPSLVAGLAMTMYDIGQAEEGNALLDQFMARHPKLESREMADARLYLNPPPPYTPPPVPETPYREQQAAIVAKGREGKTTEAVKEMTELHRLYPEDVYVTGDLIVLLHWERMNEAALELVPDLDLALAHDYVVVAVMRSLMAIGNHYRAQRFLDEAILAQRGNAELMVAGAMPLALAGEYDSAAGYLRRAEESRVPGIGNRIADAKKATGMDLIDDIDNLDRINRLEAQRGESEADGAQKVKALNRIRASRLGREHLDKMPELALSANSRLTARHASALQTSVWGEQTAIPRDLNAHNDYFMSVLKQLDEMQTDSACDDPECRVAVGSAKVRAFYEMNMACEAIAEYEAIRELGIPLADGTILDAAGAYLGARYPAQAKCLYLELLARKDSPNPPRWEDLFEAKKGLFWALLENEELVDALTQAEVHYQEGVGGDGKPALYQNGDWRKMDINVSRGLATLYCNFMAAADDLLTQLVSEAPANAGALAALASTKAMRGLPRTANEYVHLAQIHAPSDVGLATQEATNYLNYREWRKAYSLLEATLPYYNQVNSVQRLQSDWITHNCYELRIDAAWSKVVRGQNPTLGFGATPTVEARLFSKPFLCDWRVFVGAALSSGDFQEGHASQNVYLTGAEFRSPELTATLEVRLDKVRDHKLGMGLSGEYTPDDHWRFPFSVELLSRDTPLRARYSGITANSINIGASYYWNESRSANATFGLMGFSDGNRRYSFGGNFNQRLWTCFTQYVDGQINAYTSQNSEDGNRPYFNPEQDFELGFAFTYGNLLWRCYDRSFRHALTVGAGNYWQKNYGSDIVLSVAYSHSWDYTDRFSLTYGVGFGRRVYDGDPEYAVNAFVSAVYKF